MNKIIFRSRRGEENMGHQIEVDPKIFFSVVAKVRKALKEAKDTDTVIFEILDLGSDLSIHCFVHHENPPEDENGS